MAGTGTCTAVALLGSRTFVATTVANRFMACHRGPDGDALASIDSANRQQQPLTMSYIILI